MLGAVTLVCLVLAAVLVAVTAVRALRDQAAATVEFGLAAVLGLAVLVYDVVRVVDLVRGPKPASTTLAVAYLVGIALIMPVTTALGLAERSKWGPVTIGAGAIVVAVLFKRIDQVWTGG